MNKLEHSIRTVFLLVLLSAIFLGVGYLLGGRSGVLMAFILSLAMNGISYWFSDKIVLMAHQAKELGLGNEVYAMVKDLSLRNRLPMPKVYLIPDKAPNAFATGRDPKHSAVAVTQGLLNILEPNEVKGVLAHELGHVQNRDILISTIVATMASAIMYIAHMAQWFGIFGGNRDGEGRGGVHPLALILVVVLAPIATMLVQFAVSRSREYEADATGARLCGDPESLASALEKISNPALVKRFQNQEMMPDMQPAFSHLYIVNHFSSGSALALFSTHPPVKERVKRLRSLRY